MASGRQPQLLADLVAHKYPISQEVWDNFWDRLGERELEKGEALAVVCSLTTLTPDGESVSAMLRSLQERNPRPSPPSQPTVNIVGTGGGPSTFNLSTASAFVGASMGARVIKTGSRAYASKTGSIDLLDRLGIRLTSSYGEIEEMLETLGMACAGPFVYPKELRLLARNILPFGMKQMGRFFNLVGPFLGAVPVTKQITGTSDHSVVPMFKDLAAGDSTREYWITWNDMGVDELLSTVPSQVYDTEGGKEYTLSPADIGLSEDRPFDELKPVDDIDSTVAHFMALIGGDGPPAAIESIKLNAGALAINAGIAKDWPEALQRAGDAMAAGEPERLIDSLRAHGEDARAGVASAKGSGDA
jgi:anthranilate phosphoribosyltransferase